MLSDLKISVFDALNIICSYFDCVHVKCSTAWLRGVTRVLDLRVGVWGLSFELDQALLPHQKALQQSYDVFNLHVALTCMHTYMYPSLTTRSVPT